MHPRLARAPFTHADWNFETKLDGFRALAGKIGRNVELVSRQGRSFADAFPEVIAALEKLRTDVVLDCELVVVDARGHPQWERLRRHALVRRPSWALDAARKEPATLCARSTCWLSGGRDVRAMPLAARKTRLAHLLEGVEGLALRRAYSDTRRGAIRQSRRT